MTKEELKQAEKVKVVERFEAYGQCRDSRRIAELEKQLTKAKEIIRELLSSCFGYTSKTVNYEAKAKAEAFLKEE